MEGQSKQLWSILMSMLAGIVPGVGSVSCTTHTPDRCVRIHRGDNQQGCMGSDNTIEDASQDEDSKNVLSLAQAPQGSDQSSELQQGLSLPDMHALEQPSQSGSSAVPCLNTRGFNSYAGTSLQDAASQGEENSAVRGASDCDVFYDAVSLLAPLTAASQDFWDNLETEPSSDNPFDDAAGSFVITACDSGESDIFFACDRGREPTARQVFAAKAARPALAATKAAAEAVLRARWAALHAGLLPKGAHLAPGHPKRPDAGFNSRDGISFRDAASHDAESSTVGGDCDCDVFYDAHSILAPWTPEAQDFWANLDTEASSDNPFDDAASSFVITACDSEESDIFFACDMGREPTARQVYAAKATGHALAATSAAAEALHAGLLPKGAHLAPGHPKHPDAGFNSRDGISFRDAASHDAESSTVGGDCDCDVFYDAHSILAPWTPEAQDFWANLDTEASSDNPFDDAASTAYPPTIKFDSSTNNKFFRLRSHLRSKRSARQKPSLMKWAKRSLKRLKSTGVRISSGIQRCTAVPKVKDCGAEEYIHTPKQKVMTAAEALILVTC